MTRIPLRPLARILQARAKGENPDGIERENKRLRNEQSRDRARTRAQLRLLILSAGFIAAFLTVGVHMGSLAASVPVEPRRAGVGGDVSATRADIHDRNGRILATNMLTHALYAHPRDMMDPAGTAEKLSLIFPEMKAADLLRRFTDGRSFLWLRRVLSPEQMQAVHDIGDPGLLFGPREMRLYPNGTLAAHVLGGAAFGDESVRSAEVKGTAGVELALDARLRDPAQANQPLALSIDLTIQATMEEILSAGQVMMNAKGAAGILMDVRSGEILALASYPTFDPNDRPNPVLPEDAEPGDSPLFNRAVQGVYELGSTFKIFAVAQAMDLGLLGPETMVDANAPMQWGKHKIKEWDNHNYGPLLSVSDVIAKSSNVATARIALMIGGVQQQAFLRSLGLLDPSPVELAEAPKVKPLIPPKWPDIVTITASYGHGISSSPLNLAAAYATIANGGMKVTPTLLRGGPRPPPERVMSAQTAQDSVAMLRRVVTEGTASFGEVPGYAVAGKTGTAEKPRRGGGYYENKVINTFAAMFPANDPAYVLIVTLDEPVETTGPKPRRTAGWTAVPVAAEIIRRTAPLLGLRPQVELGPLDAVTAVKQ